MQEILSPALNGSVETPLGAEKAHGERTRIRSFLPFKRGLDVSVAVTFLLIFAPLLISMVCLMFLAQGRPVFIKHKRIGRGGKLFPCLKFRTMTNDADAVLQAHIASDQEARVEWEATRKLKNDPRVTPLGIIMRKTSLDEIPQFINVLRGEMSLVGPRPIVADEMKFYGPHLHLYKSVRPGLTGSWQIGGRNDVSYSRRVQMDADYVMNWTLAQDVSILMKTVPAVFLARGSY